MTTSQLGWTRPVLIEAGTQSVDVHKQWIVSLQVSAAAVLVQPLLACSSERGVKNLCEISHIEQMEKQFFFHFHIRQLIE
jgi:hypothetical protein